MCTTNLIRIATIGDSLTEGSARLARIGPIICIPHTYQFSTYEYLKENGHEIEVVNHGIGGQIINEITSRFEETLPTDFLVSMSGTNDLWQFSDMGDGIEKDIMEDYRDEHDEKIEKIFDICKKNNWKLPKIVLCSIPPFGNVRTLPENIQNTVKFLNQEIEKYAQEKNYVFSDVHKAMRNSDDFYMDSKNCVDDGVHFTIEGNKTCGEAIGKTLHDLL